MEKTLAQFIQENSLTINSKQTDRNENMCDDGNWEADHWICTIRRAGPVPSTMKVSFSQGVGHRTGGVPNPPNIADVLDCLASDSASVENARSFEDWCADSGHDSDSRKAERVYNKCREQATALRTLLGDTEYETLLWNVERL